MAPRFVLGGSGQHAGRGKARAVARCGALEHGNGKAAQGSRIPVATVQAVAVAKAVEVHEKVSRSSVATPSAPTGSRKGWSWIEQRLTVGFPPEVVWDRLADIRQVSSCLPGAEITELGGARVKGRMNVALGPMEAAFNGDGKVLFDPERRIGRLSGGGRDVGEASLKGEAISEQSVKPLGLWSLIWGVFKARLQRWRGMNP